jgi:O-antigen/teichoic acid export membrane protein
MAVDEGSTGSLKRHELREAALHGVRWMAIAKVASELVLLVSTVVLARLLSPAEFGRAAVAMIAGAFALAITSQSFGAPLVQRKSIEREHVESAFFMSLALGAGLSLVTFALAPILAGPLFGDATAGLVRLASPLFFLAGLSVVPYASLQRELDFRRLSTIEIASRIAGTAASVAFAAAGLGAESLVLGAIVAAVVSTAQVIAAAPLGRAWPHRSAAREIVSFGLPAALSGLVRQANRNVDYAILGAQLGAAQVGFYWRAFQFGIEYQTKISSIMLRVAFPVYSRTKNLADMRLLRSRIVRVHATLLFPLLALLIAGAPVLLPWLLGERWAPAVEPTQILALAGMTAVIMTGLGPLVLALGKPRLLLQWNVISLIPYAIMILLTAPHGIIAVCWGVVAIRTAMVFATHAFLFKPLAGIPVRALWHDAGPAAVSSAALLAVAWPLAHWLADAGLTPFLLLPIIGAAGLAAYLLVLYALFKAAWADVILLVSRVLRRRRAKGGGAVPGLAESAAGAG